MATSGTPTISIGPKTKAQILSDSLISGLKLTRLIRHTNPTLKRLHTELSNLCMRLVEAQELYGAIGCDVVGASRWALAISDSLEKTVDILWRIERLFEDYQIALETHETVPKEWNEDEVEVCIKKLAKCSETLSHVYAKLEARYLPPPLTSTIQRIVRTSVSKHGSPLSGFAGYDDIRDSFLKWCKSNGISSEYLEANKAELNRALVDAIHQHQVPNRPAAEQSSIYLLPSTTPERTPSQWRALNVFSRIKRRASYGNIDASERASSSLKRNSYNAGPVLEIRKKLALGQVLTKEEELINAAQSCEKGAERRELLTQYLQLQAATGDLGARDMDLISLFER